MNLSEASTPTVILVEDENNLRDALETLIHAAGYRCASFASGEAFLSAALPRPPCCLLLDLHLDGRSGLEIQDILNSRKSYLQVLFVTGDNSTAHAVRAMKAGAMDFLQKPFNAELLLERVEVALQASMDNYIRRETIERNAALLAGLTAREREILALLVDGNFNKEIARSLGISTRTVESHRMRIMEKLGARTLADLTRVWLCSEAAIPN